MNTLRDETYGIGKEIELFSKLKELHGSTLIKTPNKYSSFVVAEYIVLVSLNPCD